MNMGKAPAAAEPGCQGPWQKRIGRYPAFFGRELKRLNIPVRFQTPLTKNLLTEVAPDHVVLATGSMPQMPVIKGLFTTP